MKSSVIREMTNEELQDKLVDEKQAIVKLKLQHTVSPLENTQVLKAKRKVVARINTEITKRSRIA